MRTKCMFGVPPAASAWVAGEGVVCNRNSMPLVE